MCTSSLWLPPLRFAAVNRSLEDMLETSFFGGPTLSCIIAPVAPSGAVKLLTFETQSR